jgi:hypothetical protein
MISVTCASIAEKDPDQPSTCAQSITIAPPGRKRMPALTAPVSNARGNPVPARRAVAAADTHHAPNLAGHEEQHPQHRGVEDRVDRKAGPDGMEWDRVRTCLEYAAATSVNIASRTGPTQAFG